MTAISFNILCNTEESAKLQEMNIESDATEYRQGYIIAEKVTAILLGDDQNAVIYTGEEAFYTDSTIQEATEKLSTIIYFKPQTELTYT